MPELFSYGPRSLKAFVRNNHVAILYTIILHLLVAIVLLLVKVEGLKNDAELGVLLDFTEEVTLEELLQEENIEVPPEWIEQVFEARAQASNRAVNLNDQVNTEISTEEYVNELLNELESQKDEEFLKDRERLKEIISSKVFEEEPLPDRSEDEEDSPYTGPTTITYEFLEPPVDRSDRFLAIPVYRCEGSALVIVELVVRRDGSVENVRVESAETANDPNCFTDAAREAALSSRFNSNYNGPDKQKARITYQFVAQ